VDKQNETDPDGDLGKVHAFESDFEDKESGTRTMKGDGAKGWFLIFVL